jgi:hypothetical protein
MAPTIDTPRAWSPVLAPLSGAPTTTLHASPAATRAAGAVGSLLDADLALETAQLTDLHIRQSHKAAVSKANPTPQTLLSLFGDA